MIVQFGRPRTLVQLKFKIL